MIHVTGRAYPSRTHACIESGVPGCDAFVDEPADQCAGIGHRLGLRPGGQLHDGSFVHQGHLAAAPGVCACVALACYWLTTPRGVGGTYDLGTSTLAQVVTKHVAYIFVAVFALIPAVFGDPHVGHFGFASLVIDRCSCSNFAPQPSHVYS